MQKKNLSITLQKIGLIHQIDFCGRNILLLKYWISNGNDNVYIMVLTFVKEDDSVGNFYRNDILSNRYQIPKIYD